MLASPTSPAPSSSPAAKEITKEATPAQNPASSSNREALFAVQVTKEEMIQALVNNQRRFTTSVLNTKSPTQISAEKEASQALVQGGRDVINKNSDLNKEHVEGALRIYVGARDHLNQEVAVLPVIHLPEFARVATEFAHQKVIAHEGYKPYLPAKTPLKEKKDCKNPIELAERDAEQRKRDEQDRALNREAIRVLNDNKIGQSLVEFFLEGMTSEPFEFLGNTTHKALPFSQAKQFIIPIRKGTNPDQWGDTHYYVAVVNCNKEAKTAEFTFYDSMGGEIEKLFKDAIENFFTKKGYKVNFKSIAKHDQTNDAYNCGIFAVLAGIEIASRNKGIEERLIENFHKENYQDVSDNLRIGFANALKDMGYNIEVDPALEKRMAHSHKGAFCLNELAKLLDTLTQKIQEMSGKKDALPLLASQSLVDLKANIIFERCNYLRTEMQKLLEAKMSAQNKTPQDEEQINFLIATIYSVNLAHEEYKAKMQKLEIDSEGIFAWYDYFSAQSLTTKWVMGAALLTTLVLSGLYLPWFVAKAASFLPSNIFVTFIASTLLFVGALKAYDFLSAESEEPTPPKQDADHIAAAQTEAVILEVGNKVAQAQAQAAVAPAENTLRVDDQGGIVVPPVTPQFSGKRKEPEGGSVAAATPPLGEASELAAASPSKKAK